MGSHSEVVLFAVVGMSPAVLTETVWALAYEKKPVIPDRVVVLTTTFARKKLREQLFAPDKKGISGWGHLPRVLRFEGFDIDGKLKFGLTGDSIKVFTDISMSWRSGFWNWPVARRNPCWIFDIVI